MSWKHLNFEQVGRLDLARRRDVGLSFEFPRLEQCLAEAACRAEVRGEEIYELIIERFLNHGEPEESSGGWRDEDGHWRRSVEGLHGVRRRRVEAIELRDPDYVAVRQRMWARASNAVRRALASGKLVRPGQCTRCSIEGKVEAAHRDYSKPLDIEWLCLSCHRTWDALNPKSKVAAA